MSNRTKAKLNAGGIILDPRRIEEPTPIRMGESIETLEGLRDTIAAQHWADPSAQHSVLYGIKMCIHALKQKQPSTEHEWVEGAEIVKMTRDEASE